MQDHLQQQQTGASMPATANALPDVTAAAATARANVSRVATSLTDARTRLDRVQQSIMHLQVWHVLQFPDTTHALMSCQHLCIFPTQPTTMSCRTQPAALL